MLDYSAFLVSESHPIMFHNNHWDPFELHIPVVLSSPGTSPSLCAPSLWCYCQLGLPHQSQLPSSAPCHPHCVWSVCQESLVGLELEVQQNLRSVVLTSDYMCPTGTFWLLIHTWHPCSQPPCVYAPQRMLSLLESYTLLLCAWLSRLSGSGA